MKRFSSASSLEVETGFYDETGIEVPPDQESRAAAIRRRAERKMRLQRHSGAFVLCAIQSDYLAGFRKYLGNVRPMPSRAAGDPGLSVWRGSARSASLRIRALHLFCDSTAALAASRSAAAGVRRSQISCGISPKSALYGSKSASIRERDAKSTISGSYLMSPPLRKATRDGTLYRRRPEVEVALNELRAQPRARVVDRCSVTDPTKVDYLASECLLHLVREARSDNSADHFAALYRELRRRVLARLPAPKAGRMPDGKVPVSQTKVDVCDAVMARFQELLMLDRQGYEERLDYFEVNFDDAVAALRSTAKRKAWRHENRTAPMTYDDETSELNAEIEEAAAGQNPISESKIDDPGYRSRLDKEIERLPEPLRLVMELLLKGYPIESKEPGVSSVANILGCSEKTVRNRRDKAIAVLREALNEEET